MTYGQMLTATTKDYQGPCADSSNSIFSKTSAQGVGQVLGAQ